MADHEKSSTSTKACLACRKVKMRCLIKRDEITCERCARKSLECIFQEHRRGRKRGSRNAKKLATRPSGESLPDRRQILHTEISLTSDGSDSRDLQPPGLLNRAATRGTFSLHNVLNPAIDENSLEQGIASDAARTDPIRLGYVNTTIAESLFDHFINVLNPYISQLDPALHTMSYVRQRSAFLFTTMLAVAAKTFNSAVYRVLYDHAETLMADCFRKGEKSVEIAQAMMIMTYWKEPDDARAWVFLGYVIRMGMDLGWHLLRPCDAQDSSPCDSNQMRELRNIQRTWYVLFVYDHSMSLQTGKPWMIERNDFIQSIEKWCTEPLSSANDRLLGAFVTVRLLGSEVFQLLRSNANKIKTGSLHGIESLVTVLSSQLEEWEQKWIPRVEANARHAFMVRFYGMHLRLQLFSLPLQAVLASSDRNINSSLGVLWTSYSSAMEMLELICRSSEWLYFAQDSIHVMTAYSAAFLVKLLLSAPESITMQIESKVIQTIRAASLVFSQQSAPPTSSCALQARFLERIQLNFTQTRHSNTSNMEGFPENTSGVSNNVIPRQIDSFRVLEYPAPLRVEDSSGTSVDAGQNASQMVSLDWLLEPNDSWNNMFAHAGFGIEEGIFFA